MIIDFHAHLEFKNVDEKYSPSEFVAGMDKGGIDISCVYGNDQADPGSCPSWRDEQRMAVPTNYFDEELASFCKKFPQQLIGVTSINPNRYQQERKVDKAINKYGINTKF